MDTGDIDSTCSQFSEVSFRGTLVDAETAVDASVKDVQDGLNSTCCLLREMLQLDERGEDYSIMKEKYDEVDSILKEGVALLKELRTIAKQLVPPKPKATKKDLTSSMLDECGGGKI